MQLIYKSFLAGMGPYKIAAELNGLGYRLPGGRLFYSAYVHGLIGFGHVYTGRVAFFKIAEVSSIRVIRYPPCP